MHHIIPVANQIVNAAATFFKEKGGNFFSFFFFNEILHLLFLRETSSFFFFFPLKPAQNLKIDFRGLRARIEYKEIKARINLTIFSKTLELRKENDEFLKSFESIRLFRPTSLPPPLLHPTRPALLSPRFSLTGK